MHVRASPHDPLRRDFRRFRVDFGAAFVAFQGCITRATRLAARRAKPLFLLTGAVLSRVRQLCNEAENRRKSMARRSNDASRTRRARKARFFRSRMRFGVDLGRLGALPGVPGRSFWRPVVSLEALQALPRRAGDASRRSRDAPGTPLGTSGRPENDFESILGSPNVLGPTPSD